MILLDTSAIYALADRRDANHPRATTLFRSADESGEPLLLHSYIISEAASLLQRRLGLAAALAFVRQVADFTVHWLGPEDHEEASRLLEARSRRGLSLVDCASFAVMRRYGITHAFTFDADFEREGFALYAGQGP